MQLRPWPPARVVAVLVLVLAAAACSSSTAHNSRRATATTTSSVAAPATGPRTSRPQARFTVDEQHLTDLAHPVQDAAAGPVQGGVVVVGGLDPAGSSTDRAVSLTGGSVHDLRPFPHAFHDAAAAAVSGALYVFGGGDASGQFDTIWRVTAGGAASRAGVLPARSSDASATTIGRTAYVVGGYTGNAWLDTVIAYRPGEAPRVVAHQPEGRRYAGVASAGHDLYVLGGSTPHAPATTEVLRVDVSTGTTERVASLPRPLTHLAAINIGGRIVAVGGHGTSTSDVSDAIFALDPRTEAVTLAGHLALGRSDLALTSDGTRVLAIGGRTASGRTGFVGVLAPAATDTNVYAHTGSTGLSPVVNGMRSLVYVPNSGSNTVDVIDPAPFQVIDPFAVGGLPQHVTPSWDLRTLYVDNDAGNSLTPIDPRTGKPRGPALPVDDPYNLYFTPDGRSAIVVAERNRHLDFRDPHTMALHDTLTVPCDGIDHMDFTVDGSRALASCEYSGQMVVVDLATPRVTKVVTLPQPHARPQDVKLAPDGRVFYVADMNHDGVWLIDARTFGVRGLLHTGRGAHGLYPSRDATKLYVSNRDEGSISVVDFATRTVVATWSIPGGSPDMGGVSVDGKVLWLTGRYNGEVYAISTVDGRLLARIKVGSGPHGLCVWPQPGRYSIGHTGNTR